MFSLKQATNWDNSLLDKSMLLISHAGKEIIKRHNFMATGLWSHFSNIIYNLLVTWACIELALKIRRCMAENSHSVRCADTTNKHLNRFVVYAWFYPVWWTGGRDAQGTCHVLYQERADPQVGRCCDFFHCFVAKLTSATQPLSGGVITQRD